jgi:N-glycosylase/DNA lyase
MYRFASEGDQVILRPNHGKCQRLIQAIVTLDSPPGMLDTAVAYNTTVKAVGIPVLHLDTTYWGEEVQI